MKTKFTVLAIVLSMCLAVSAYAEEDSLIDLNSLEKNVVSSVGLLYGKTMDGAMTMHCTATAFEREGDVYRFVTAAHCVAVDDIIHERVQVVPVQFFVTFDKESEVKFYSAKLVAVGYMHNGDDFAVFEATLDRRIGTMPLAVKNPSLGENFVNYAGPLGLGLALYRGHVSMAKINRPIISDEINWVDASMLQGDSGPGSSGSAIVSQRQKGIIAILVGGINDRGYKGIVVIPVEKFHKFWNAAKAGKYKWYRPDEMLYNRSMDEAAMKTVYKRAKDGLIFHLDRNKDKE